jgi:NAD kinase
MQSKIENAIIVRSKTRLEQLTERFNTKEQAKFYIARSQEAFYSQKKPFTKNSGVGFNLPQKKSTKLNSVTNDFADYEMEEDAFYDSMEHIQVEISKKLKVKVLEQEYLTNYIFTEKDVVIVIGQDGLVANTAKYVNGRPIIAINPDESRYDGVLLPFNAYNFMPALDRVIAGNYQSLDVTLAEVVLNDGQRLLAFNEFFIGVSSHASSRYQITYSTKQENHSSSGIIVSTGAGSTGWLSSIFNMANGLIKEYNGGQPIINYSPMSKDIRKLIFVVREPFISKTSQASIIAGEIFEGATLTIESLMPQNGIIFSDGIQSDFLTFNSGSIAEIGVAKEKAILVI